MPKSLRQIYLRFGPSTLLSCPFCHQDDTTSYILYHIPTNTVFPHLFHILTIGLATSETVSGYEAATWRQNALLCALLLATVDIFLTATYAPIISTSIIAPAGTFWIAGSIRYLTLLAFDAVLAFLIYTSTTGRFYLFPTLSTTASLDPELNRRRTEDLLTQTNLSLQMTSTNLRAYSIARNAVVRNPSLKGVDDEYWRTVVAVEGETLDGDVFEDEEVQAAVARAYGSGGINVDTVRREAEGFVRHATRGLDGR
ncbi:hypothetical protein H2200_003020 [Cladophialophora chaetospira]|uniref:Uncharacterized protein n=1 Tax=Cladophialophora chaetospira TaxID=386627 RepID=A0AA38XGM7_9EURO|nr:hypothetical protein H2200_003020 [Cladophialophora chaetospira]